MLNFLFLVQLHADDVVFLVEQESILCMFSVTGEYINQLGGGGGVSAAIQGIELFSHLRQMGLIESIHMEIFW